MQFLKSKRSKPVVSALAGSGIAVVMLVLLWVPVHSHSYYFDLQMKSTCPPPALSCTGSTIQYQRYAGGDWITFSLFVNVSVPTGEVGLYDPSGQQVYSTSGSTGSGTYLVTDSAAGDYAWHISLTGSLPSYGLYFFSNATWYTPLF